MVCRCEIYEDCPECRNTERDMGLRLTLSDAEWNAFVHRLNDPPKPNAALRKLMRRKR